MKKLSKDVQWWVKERPSKEEMDKNNDYLLKQYKELGDLSEAAAAEAQTRLDSAESRITGLEAASASVEARVDDIEFRCTGTLASKEAGGSGAFELLAEQPGAGSTSGSAGPTGAAGPAAGPTDATVAAAATGPPTAGADAGAADAAASSAAGAGVGATSSTPEAALAASTEGEAGPRAKAAPKRLRAGLKRKA